MSSRCMLLFIEYVTLQLEASEFSSVFYGYYFHDLFHHKYYTNFYKHAKQMEYNNNEH